MHPASANKAACLKDTALLARILCISQPWPYFTARLVNWIANWRSSTLKRPVSMGVDFSKTSWLGVYYYCRMRYIFQNAFVCENREAKTQRLIGRARVSPSAEPLSCTARAIATCPLFFFSSLLLSSLELSGTQVYEPMCPHTGLRTHFVNDP